MKVKVRKVHERAYPLVVEKGNVGINLRSVEDITLEPHKTTKVRTGWAISSIPDVFVIDEMNSYSNYGRSTQQMLFNVFPKLEGRSGLAADSSVFPVGAIVDHSYRGEIIVILANISTQPYVVMAGDKIAQAVFYVSIGDNITFVEDNNVVTTSRGEKGFGSSGR